MNTNELPTAETIKAHLLAGGKVQITTYTQSTIYGPKCANMFKTSSNGHLYVQRGKHWDDCSYCGIRLSKLL